MIHARGLARTFRTRRGTVEAVTGVDIDVAPGELVGFLGPNGAGKSTTLRMLTTLIHPTAGTATVAGHDLLTEPVQVRRRIGYVGQNGGAGPDCLLAEELILQGRFYGLSAAESATRAAELIRDLDLTGLDTRVVNTLSGGQ
ncbi:MAG: ATP-binding cassette domain-containing protein, partial [Pseudonocardiales bacterium]|nr:ATP-binding cassette domain-containing protein [Pseudonocardiales bacterium]